LRNPLKVQLSGAKPIGRQPNPCPDYNPKRNNTLALHSCQVPGPTPRPNRQV